MADKQQTQNRRGLDKHPDTGRAVTTVFISNLHCSSCVSSIRKCLEAVDPSSELLSHSIISHSVTLRHSPSLSVREIRDAIEQEGFEVHSSFAHEHADQSSSENELRRSTSPGWQSELERAVAAWKQRRNSKMAETESSRRHIDQCKECQVETQEIGIFETGNRNVENAERLSIDDKPPFVDESRVSSSRSVGDSFVMVESPPEDLYRASISIHGMTCSACVNSITSAVKELGCVRSVNVNLVTASATVIFANRDRINQIKAAIEDTGFNPVVSNIEAVDQAHAQKKENVSKDKWIASYAIGGMTCSSCVSNVSSALKQLQGVKRSDVNLLSNSATVWFSDIASLQQIKDAIESSGYDAVLTSVVEAESSETSPKTRLVEVKVSGMYCHHCPGRISDVLRDSFGTRVKIEKQLSQSDPVMRLSYVPNAPNFTIRQIIDAVEGVNSSFGVSVYHPPSIEDRSRDVHQREKMRYLLRLLLSITLAIPTFLIGIVFMDLVPSNNSVKMFLMRPIWAGNVTRSQWALFILSSPSYFFAADVFHLRALKEIRALWRPGSRASISQRFFRFGSMNMLMSLGTTIAYFASIAELAMVATGVSDMSHSGFYFDSVVFLTMFLLMGRYLEAYSKAKTGDAVGSLGNLRPKNAILVDGIKKVDRTLPLDLLEVGDIVRVPHGATPPFDGVILTGSTKFEESSLTGESKPVTKAVGDTVYCGTINKGSAVSISLSSISGTSMLDKIIAVVREGQTKRAPVERVADKITSHFVPFVIFVAITTWVVWLALGKSGILPHDWRDSHEGGWELWSLRFAIAVFVVAFPFGICLAAPTALFVGGGLAARHGILVKGGGEAFQEASSLDCVVFDKTGTLTEGGNPMVSDFEIVREFPFSTSIKLLKTMEENSNHPISKALVAFTKSCEEHKRDLKIDMLHVEEVPGKGLRGSCRLPEHEDYPLNAIIGSEAFMQEHGVEVSSFVQGTINSWKREGKSVALFASNVENSLNLRLAAAFAISDPIRPEAFSVVSTLQKRGISVWMLSGDNMITAKAVGSQLNIPAENIIAGVLPDQKAAKIRYLQSSLTKEPSRRLLPFTKSVPRRATVAMVGDGINDSPALSNADVSIAIGSGSDVAVSSAHFILVNSNLTSLLVLTDLSRKVLRRVRLNFAWALVYNVVAMPVAAGVFYPLVSASGTHVRLDPVWASLAMALSSLSVVCSSLLLRSRLPGVGFRTAAAKV